jgi:hypothetical protein
MMKEGALRSRGIITNLRILAENHRASKPDFFSIGSPAACHASQPPMSARAFFHPAR